MGRANARTERGAAAVEFALVMLPLVVLLFGAVQYGLYFWAMQGGSDIARDAARVSSVYDAPTLSCSAFRAKVRDQIDGLVGDSGAATINRTYVDAQSPADGVTVGDTVRVSVQFRSIDLNFPFVPFIHDGRVTSTVESRVDFADPDHQPENCT